MNNEYHETHDHYFDRILLVVDGSDAAKKAAMKALLLGKLMHITVIAIFVIDTSKIVRAFPHSDRVISPQHLEMAAEWKKQARDFLSEIKQLGEKSNVKVLTELHEGIPEVEIMKKAKINDLIVVGGKKASFLDRVLLLSTLEQVIHRTTSSVLLVR